MQLNHLRHLGSRVPATG